MKQLWAVIALAWVAGCVADGRPPAAASHAPQYVAGKLYNPDADAASDLAAARAFAAQQGKPLLAIFGANWCHDSRALAEALTQGETGRFAQENFSIIFVDAGIPQIEEGRNLELAAELGVNGIVGTPTLIALATDGTLLNGETARGWRNAASRSKEEILASLKMFLSRAGKP